MAKNEQYELDNNLKISAIPKSLIYFHNGKKATLAQRLSFSSASTVVKRPESAFKNFFQKRSDFPIQEKRRQRELSFSAGCKFNHKTDRLYLPKIQFGFAIAIVEVLGEIKNVTVSRRYGRYFVSIQTE